MVNTFRTVQDWEEQEQEEPEEEGAEEDPVEVQDLGPEDATSFLHHPIQIHHPNLPKGPKSEGSYLDTLNLQPEY